MPTLSERIADSGGYLADVDLTEGLAPGEVLEGAEFEGCRFDGCVLEKAVIRSCTFVDCTFTGCNLSMADLDGSRFTDCRFVDCKALAVAWSRAGAAPLSTRPWDFERCRLDLGSFRDVEAASSRFADCSMREVDLAGADLRRGVLTGADLAGATFAATDLCDADLTGASGYLLDPGTNRIRGLRVDVPGAAGILRAMGVLVDG